MTYEKGVFAQAEPGIVSGSTIERKKMSTKTIYKRIALVAVAALGAGLLSVAPASAATAPFSYLDGATTGVINENTTPVVDNQTISTTASTNGAVRLSAVGDSASYAYINVNATGATPVLTAATRPFKTGFAVDGTPDYCQFTNVGAASGSTVTGTRFNGDDVEATDIAPSDVYDWDAIPAPLGALCAEWISAGTEALITIPTTTAGTITVTISGQNGNDSTTLQTFTIIVGSSASTEYAKTRVVYNASANGWGLEGLFGSDGAVYSPAVNQERAVKLEIQQLTAAGNDVATAKAKAVEVTLTGVGYLYGYGNDEVAGVTRVAIPAAFDDLVELRVVSDGRSGLATVVTKVDGVVVDTLQVKFYGAPKTITIVPFLTIGKAGGGVTGEIDSTSSTLNEFIDADGGNDGSPDTDKADVDNAPAYGVIMKDSNGFNIPSSNFTAGTSNSLVVASACSDSFLEDGSGLNTAGQPWVTHCEYTTSSTAVSGQTANITATVINVDGTIVTASTPITIGGAPSTVSVAFGASSYAIGTPATIVVTAKDAAGNPVHDQALVLSAAGLVSNLNTAGTSFGASATTKGGSVTVKTFAPVVTGSWSVTGTDVNGKSVSATSTVTPSADVAAITTLVNSLLAKINALNKLVVKIQKKVRA
jgi:hypothetical protein